MWIALRAGRGPGLLALICCVLTALAPWAAAQDAPKNVIVMISDGCGFMQVEAADRWRHGAPDMSLKPNFPVCIAMHTHSLEGPPYDAEAAWTSFDWRASGATDSAAAATALATGHKTYNSAIGVIPVAWDEEGGVTAVEAVMNLSERAKELGKASGVITSVQFSHATPAGFVAHNESRGNYVEIAQEMLLRSKMDVVMGCGHPWYDDQGYRVDEADYTMVGGARTWIDATTGRPAADADGDGQPDAWVFIEDREQFVALGTGDAPSRVLGVPKVRGTLQQGREGDANAAPYVVPLNEDVPTLAEMARAALNVLGQNENGLFLMIEGGAIDWACHANQLGRLIEEELDFIDAIGAVREWVEANSSWEETLLVITADHETGYLTPAGTGDEDGKLVWPEPADTGPNELPALEWHSGGHTNSVVPFAAIGAGAELYLERVIGEDPHWGPYIDNTDLPKLIFELWSR
jgi:alkaline phosphatase